MRDNFNKVIVLLAALLWCGYSSAQDDTTAFPIDLDLFPDGMGITDTSSSACTFLSGLTFTAASSNNTVNLSVSFELEDTVLLTDPTDTLFFETLHVEIGVLDEGRVFVINQGIFSRNQLLQNEILENDVVNISYNSLAPEKVYRLSISMIAADGCEFPVITKLCNTYSL